jgi:hypothetical protein
MLMGLVGLGHKVELCRIVVYAIRSEIREVVGRIGLRVKEWLETKGFRGEIRENIKEVSGNNVGKVRDKGEAILHIGGLRGGHVNR